MRHTFITAAATATLALSVVGCKKDDAKDGAANAKANPGAGRTSPADREAPSPAPRDEPPARPDPTAHVPTDPSVDFAVATINHAEPKQGDPVRVVFQPIEVKSVTMKDTRDLTGATAEIHIDLGDPKSGVADRDKSLRSANFFDASQNPVAVVKITDVKKAGDKAYSARAEVTAMGHTQIWPVTFEVVAAEDDWVRVKGSHKFKRSDFKIGEGARGPADELELQLNLTLEKS